MFTGIIEELGIVRGRQTMPTDWGEGVRLSITARKGLAGPQSGDRVDLERYQP